MTNKEDTMTERTWQTLSGKRIDDVYAEIARLNAASPRQIHIGTDAQYRGSKMVFASAVAVLNPGKGGMAYHSRIAFPGKEYTTLAQKLFKEVEFSIEIAQGLAEILPTCYHENIIVHVDANPNVIHNSSDYHKALVGWVVGAGFECLSKPDSWAATHLADHIANGKNVRDTKVRRQQYPRVKKNKRKVA